MVFISFSLALSRNTLPRTQCKCDIQVTTLYLSKVFSGIIYQLTQKGWWAVAWGRNWPRLYIGITVYSLGAVSWCELGNLWLLSIWPRLAYLKLNMVMTTSWRWLMQHIKVCAAHSDLVLFTFICCSDNKELLNSLSVFFCVLPPIHNLRFFS